MAKELESGSELLPTGEKKKISKPDPGIYYLNGTRYLMTGNSVSVAIPDGANYIKIYAEHDDIRIGINIHASPDSPMIAFGGLSPEVLDRITNLKTLALYGAAGQYASVSFFSREV